MSVQVLCPACGNVAELHRPPADAAQLAMTAILHVCIVGFTAWYLYRKPNVRAYFEARADPAPVHDDA